MELLKLLERPPNSAHRIVRRVPQEFNEDTIYSRRCSFDIDKNLGGLAQCWIKMVASTGSDVSKSSVPQGLNILQYVRLTGETGPIQTLDRVTLLARTDLILGSGLYERLRPGIDGIGVDGAANDFSDGPVTYFVPLFWFFCDLKGDYLDTRYIKNLKIEVGTLPTMAAMGMDVPLTSLRIELFTYHVRPREYVHKPISYSYDRYEEETISIAAGASSVTFRLTCPYQVFYTHFYLFVNSTAGSNQITSVKIDGPTGEWFDVHYAMNYMLSDYEDSVGGESVFSRKFGERHGDVKEFTTFGQSMTPTYATVTFKTASGALTLYTVSEYRSDIQGGDRPYLGISGLAIVQQPSL